MSEDSRSVVASPNEAQYPQYAHTPEERRFISDWWNEFLLMFMAKQEPQPLLGDNRNLQQFWDDSVRDYAVITETADDPNDPVQSYVSSVSRDKADVFISNLTGQLLYPTVKAFNQEKEISKVLAKVGRGLLEHCHNNDGFPTEDGHAKMVRYVHKDVIEGTVHVLDEFNKESGLISSLVPNEEIFIPNFWEPNIQNQSHLIRAQLNVTWENAERVFGHLPNWKYVAPSFTDFWMIQRPELKPIFQGIVRNRRIQIMWVWKALTNAQLEKEKKAGRLSSKTERAKYFNVIINDIPMFDCYNLSPYKDGLFPISKGIFCPMAKPEFYWGNSLPNKIRYDKKWLDAWKTLLRYKGKLNALKPMVSLNGNFVDEEILLPGKITPIADELDLKVIEGVAEGVNQSEVMLLNMAEQEIDRGSVAPSVAGQMPTKRMTRGEVMVSDANAKKLLDSFTQQLAFFVQSRSFPILMRAFQFIPRGDFKKIVVPEQKLSDGTRGNLEIVFEKIGKVTQDQIDNASEILLQKEIQKKRDKNPGETIFIDPDYARECKFYLKSDAASALEDTDAAKRTEFARNSQLYLSRPDLFNAKEVARLMVLHNDDPDEILADDQQQAMQAQPSQLQDFAKTPAPYAPQPNNPGSLQDLMLG